jgi:hypothetical protein
MLTRLGKTCFCTPKIPFDLGQARVIFGVSMPHSLRLGCWNPLVSSSLILTSTHNYWILKKVNASATALIKGLPGNCHQTGQICLPSDFLEGHCNQSDTINSRPFHFSSAMSPISPKRPSWYPASTLPGPSHFSSTSTARLHSAELLGLGLALVTMLLGKSRISSGSFELWGHITCGI